MTAANVVIAASCLIALFSLTSAMPEPGITRERHIIHAPIKFRVIHHYKVTKVPIIIKKHLYYIREDHKKNPPFGGDNSNHIHHHRDHLDIEGHHEEEHRISHHQDDHESSVDYEEPRQSQEEEYEDYEYE